MTKKVFRSVFSVAIAVLLLSMSLIMGALYNYFHSVQQNELRYELNLAVSGVESMGLDYLKSLDVSGFRFTLVSNSGEVLFDSEKDISEMGKHDDREEIKEALETGFGEASRFSQTLMQETLYCAKRLSGGNVLRISVKYITVPSLLLTMVKPLTAVLVSALILSLLLAKKLSRKITAPINNLNLDKPLENNTYDELSPLLTHIARQQKQIKKQMSELSKQKNELYAVIRNMNEGLVLLNRNERIISVNPAAAEFMCTDSSCTDKDFAAVERDYEIYKALKTAEADGKGSAEIIRNEREYQVNISRIGSDGNFSGTAILIFDTTEKSLAEKSRREFTANVSHELKTPLQSIMGSAELIENGFVSDKDLPRFSGLIRSEASRLLALINDIIRLSQLDESNDLVTEQVDLYALAKEEAEILKPFAEKKNVTVSVEGESAVITGARQLLHEIIYNLCENSVKYNIDGGSVIIKVEQNEKSCVLSVSDTGIGIPPEHRDRVFERFYRIDKSRSKETGGTGLGLSIVKHAAMYHKAEISLKSEEGSGTEIAVIFQK